MEPSSLFVQHYEFLDVSLVAIFCVIFFLTSRLESRATCQNEVKRRLRTKALRWRKRDHAWWCAIRRVRKYLHKVCGIWSIGWMPMNEKKWKLLLETVGDPLQDQKSDILKRVDKRMLHWLLVTVCVRSNSKNTVMRGYILTPIAQGSLCWVRQNQSFRTWDTRTINTWPRFFSSCKRSWECQQDTQRFSMQHKCIDMVNCSCSRRLQQPSILGRILWRIRRSTRTRNSKEFRAYSMSDKNWYWGILKTFWMWKRLTVHLHPGRDQYYLMIKRSNGRRCRFRSMSGIKDTPKAAIRVE